LREPEVIAKVKLTDKQRDQIRTIEMALWGAKHDFKQTQAKGEENLESTPALDKNERILQVLTAEQQIAWRELTGTPLPGLRR
jgi:Spy/CpxP family protein refolding chaperone